MLSWQLWSHSTLAQKGQLCDKLWKGCTVCTQQTSMVSIALKAFGMERWISANNLPNAPSSVIFQYSRESQDKVTAGHPRVPGGVSLLHASEHPVRQELFLSGVGHSLWPLCSIRRLVASKGTRLYRVWSGLSQIGKTVSFYSVVFLENGDALQHL